MQDVSERTTSSCGRLLLLSVCMCTVHQVDGVSQPVIPDSSGKGDEEVLVNLRDCMYQMWRLRPILCSYCGQKVRPVASLSMERGT